VEGVAGEAVGRSDRTPLAADIADLADESVLEVAIETDALVVGEVAGGWTGCAIGGEHIAGRAGDGAGSAHSP
jgi:hypothetical protein